MNGRSLLLAALFAGGISLTPDLQDDADPQMTELTSAVDPRFTISRRHGEIRMTGHTVSRRHEAMLLEIAASAYPEHRIVSDFQAFGLVPSFWQAATTQVLYALAATESASAELDRQQLSIRSVAMNNAGWSSRMATLEASLPHDLSITSSTIRLAATDTAILCHRAFEDLAIGPVNFEESTDTLRPSAYPVLDRVAALADACRDTELAISGHTDSSGDEASNELLSLKRAQAVARYLEARGVAMQRMRMRGAGSSEPLATNETRYGRGLNRRIEFAFEAGAWR